MSDALPTSRDAAPAGPQDRPASRSAGLLGLLNRLLDHGRALLAELQQRNTPDVPPAIAHRFGAISLTLIIARITRGIMLATALHARVTRGASQLDAPDRPARKSPAATPDRGRPTRKPAPDETAELDSLPSAKEIAERIRDRPIGAVIVEICRDLGIDGEHEIWRQVLDAITCNGGSRAEMLRVLACRSDRAMALCLAPPPGPSWAERVGAMAWNAPPTLATPPP